MSQRSTMPLVPAGDARIPALGLGTWKMDGKECTESVAEALRLGYRHIDTAQMYDNHEAVGRGLEASGVDRGEVFLTSKIWFDQLEPEALRSATLEALRQLDTPYLDLLLIHWPNEEVALEATLDAMAALQGEGRIRHMGVSNFPPSWVERALAHAPIVCDQVEYHALLSQETLHKMLRAHGMAMTAYCPLAQGRLVDHDELREIGQAHGRTSAQVALRWLLQQQGVVAIPKASSADHLESNLAVLEFELTDDEMVRIHRLSERRERLCDPSFAPDWEDGTDG